MFYIQCRIYLYTSKLWNTWEYLEIIFAKAESQLLSINLLESNNNTETERALILPNSNADVERILSAMNYIKSKIRNSIKTDLLNAILVIKLGLIRNGKCCMSHKLPVQ